MVTVRDIGTISRAWDAFFWISREEEAAYHAEIRRLEGSEMARRDERGNLEVLDTDVFVDSLQDGAPDHFGFKMAARLTVMPGTNPEVLHDFAKRIPLGVTKFCNEMGTPHYLLSISARAAAVSLGAIKLEDEEMSQILTLYMENFSQSIKDGCAQKRITRPCDVCGVAPGEFHDTDRHIEKAEAEGTGGDPVAANSILEEVGTFYDPRTEAKDVGRGTKR